MKKSQETICIFGASVTAQKKGYAAILKKELPGKVYVHGYGGMHLKDAGISYIDECLAHKPNICFIDWFTTGYKDCNQQTLDYLDTIICKFTKAGCKLVFLVLPQEKVEGKPEFHNFCVEHIKKYKIPVLRIDQMVEEKDVCKVLRDSVHTTKYGSRVYADFILDYYKNHRDDEYIFPEIESAPYANVKRIIVEKEFENNIILSGCGKIISFRVLDGPHSGIWKVQSNGDLSEYNSWNRWCYYNLDMMCLSCEVDGELRIDFSQENFDVSECGDKKIDFTKYKKKMVLHEILFVGDELKIKNLTEGKRIKKEVYAWQNLTARVRRIKRRLLGTYVGE